MGKSWDDSISPDKIIRARNSDISYHAASVHERKSPAKVQNDGLNVQRPPSPREMTSMIIQARSSWLIDFKRQALPSPTFMRK